MTLKPVPMKGQWKGVVSDLPTPGDLLAFDDVLNFLCRKGRVQSRPQLNVSVTPPDNSPLRDAVTFQDVQNNYHTLALTYKNAYFITAGPPLTYNLLGYPGGIPNLIGPNAVPFATVEILQRVYFSNGNIPLQYADGSNAVQTSGDTPGGCFFMTSNSQSLIQAYTVEPAANTTGAVYFPQTVRWWGAADSWLTAPGGSNQLVEIPDAITGICTLGRNSYVFHKAGLVVMYPTGVGVPLFAFEDFSLGPKGAGNYYPYSLDVYGQISFFVSLNEIYMFDGSTLTPIGKGNKKRIFSDIEQATGTIRGQILPAFGPGFDYLSYWLTIPGPNVTWVYSYDDQNWQRFTSSAGFGTFVGFVATT